MLEPLQHGDDWVVDNGAEWLEASVEVGEQHVVAPLDCAAVGDVLSALFVGPALAAFDAKTSGVAPSNFAARFRSEFAGASFTDCATRIAALMVATLTPRFRASL